MTNHLNNNKMSNRGFIDANPSTSMSCLFDFSMNQRKDNAWMQFTD